MENTPEYWSYRAGRKLDAQIVRILTNEDGLNGRLESVLANTCAGNTLLEAGCGTGAYVYALQKSDRRCIGLDFNHDLMRMGLTMEPQASFVQGSVFDLPFSEESLDDYLSFGVIEHFSRRDQRRIVREAQRVLKPYGRAIVTVPNLYSLNTLTRPIHGLFRRLVWQKNMSSNQVRALFEEQGFRSIACWNAEVRYDLLKSLNLKRSNFAKKILFPIADLLEVVPCLGYNTYYVGEKP